MRPDAGSDTPDSVFTTAVSVELALGFLAIVLGFATGVDVRQWLPMAEWANVFVMLRGIAFGILAAVPMLAAVALIERLDWESLRSLKQFDDMPVIAVLLRLSHAELIVISIAAGIGEELLLRGWLLALITGPLDQATWFRIAAGLLISSAAFGVMHIITPAYAVIAGIFGLYLGVLVVLTHDLLIPIVAHAFYDAVHLIMAKRERNRDELTTV